MHIKIMIIMCIPFLFTLFFLTMTSYREFVDMDIYSAWSNYHFRVIILYDHQCEMECEDWDGECAYNLFAKSRVHQQKNKIALLKNKLHILA